jgi:hypothetical protein
MTFLRENSNLDQPNAKVSSLAESVGRLPDGCPQAGVEHSSAFAALWQSGATVQTGFEFAILKKAPASKLPGNLLDLHSDPARQ